MKAHWNLLLVCCVAGTCFTACRSARTFDLTKGGGGVCELHVPEEFLIEEVNGDMDAVPMGLLDGGDAVLKLSPGDHVVVVRYRVFWDVSTSSVVKLRSKPLLLELGGLQAGRTYQLTYDKPRKLKAARQFAANPQVRVTDQSGGEPRVQSTLVKREFSYSQLAGLMDFDRPVIPFSMGTEREPVDQLKYWWDKASEEEKAQFRAWIETR